MIQDYSHIPGNYGGETLREYCGLSRNRERFYKGIRIKSTGITAQRLAIAIRRHTAKDAKGGE